MNQKEAMEYLKIDLFVNPMEYVEALRALNNKARNVVRASDRLMGRNNARLQRKNVRRNTGGETESPSAS